MRQYSDRLFNIADQYAKVMDMVFDRYQLRPDDDDPLVKKIFELGTVIRNRDRRVWNQSELLKPASETLDRVSAEVLLKKACSFFQTDIRYEFPKKDMHFYSFEKDLVYCAAELIANSIEAIEYTGATGTIRFRYVPASEKSDVFIIGFVDSAQTIDSRVNQNLHFFEDVCSTTQKSSKPENRINAFTTKKSPAASYVAQEVGWGLVIAQALANNNGASVGYNESMSQGKGIELRIPATANDVINPGE
jgi:hypothetical protein